MIKEELIKRSKKGFVQQYLHIDIEEILYVINSL
jgi:hypothetical protein